ncbi:hypothetical protein ACVBEF_21180, partial [Glaciimonas sp. GG7]
PVICRPPRYPTGLAKPSRLKDRTMPNTKAPEQSSDATSSNQHHQNLSDAIDCEQSIFMLDLAARTAAFSQAVTLIFDIVEASEAYRNNPNHTNTAALALSVPDCKLLKTFTIDTATLLAEHALQEAESINTHTTTLKKARKAALNKAAQACND